MQSPTTCGPRLVSVAGPGQAASATAWPAASGTAYSRRYLVEARRDFGLAADCAPDDGEAAADLLAQARVALAEGRGELAFELLLATADRAGTAGDDAARATALAEAVAIAHRAAGTFDRQVPPGLLRDLLAEAVRIAPAADPVLAAQLAAATAWNTRAQAPRPIRSSAPRPCPQPARSAIRC